MLSSFFPWLTTAFILVGMIGMVRFSAFGGDSADKENSDDSTGERIELPTPQREGALSLEKALDERRSRRLFVDQAASLKNVAQILWATQGITDSSRGYRTAPSAGATYPLNTYLAAGNVEGLTSGVYRYLPEDHSLELVKKGDVRDSLRRAALGQNPIKDAAASIVISGVHSRITERYSQRGIRYIYMEAGHAAQNAYLQTTVLGMGMVAIGAFEDQGVSSLVDMGEGEEPLYILPFGAVAASG